MHPYTIALIGGIACGKSTALNFFTQQGIETFSADVIAKQLLAKNTKFYHAIIDHLGKKLLTPDGELNKHFLRQLLIHHPEHKRWLEQLLHPEIKRLLIKARNQVKSPYCVLEIPLLIDKTSYPVDKILSIESHTTLQRERLTSRQLSPNEIEGLLSIQTPKATRMQIADDVIDNNENKQELFETLKELHQRYLKAAKVQKTS